MIHDDRLSLFIAIISGHKGQARAISVPEMAARLGVSTRVAQQIKAAAVEQGMLIGSSCGKNHGWYYPETPDEVDATCFQYESRIRSLAKLLRRTRGADRFRQFTGELALEFEEVQA